MPVHQFLPHLGQGDAIGNHVLRLRGLLEHFGSSKIFVESTDVPKVPRVHSYMDHRPEPGETLLYHASIGTPMARYLVKQPSPVLIDYHNVTPMYFYAAYEPRVASLLYAGKSECRQFAARSPLGIADSEYSERELKEMGFGNTATIPILIDFDKYTHEPDRRLYRKLMRSKRGTDLLFVGRISPNKRQEDLIKTFAVYKREFDPNARLFLVGRSSSGRYLEAINAFIRKANLNDVHLVGGVTDAKLFAYYQGADVLVSMSEHEGFFVPLLEAWTFRLPVIAYAGGAVPGTMGEAGVLFFEKRYDEVAALIDLVVRDQTLRESLIAAGTARLEQFQPERHHRRFIQLIESVL